MDLRKQQHPKFHLWCKPSNYLSIQQLKVADGEMFTDTDIMAASRTLFWGQTVVDYLFPDGSDPIGKVVRFNSIPFRVIGVLKKKGYNSMGMDQDDLVLAPYTTVMKRIMAQTYLGGIVCSAITKKASQPAQDQITEMSTRPQIERTQQILLKQMKMTSISALKRKFQA